MRSYDHTQTVASHDARSAVAKPLCTATIEDGLGVRRCVHYLNHHAHQPHRAVARFANASTPWVEWPVDAPIPANPFAGNNR